MSALRDGGLETVRSRLPQITGYRLVLWSVLALTLAFYLWTAASSLPFIFTPGDGDPYNALTTAFLHGHTYLPVAPPAGLLNLKDPYDPIQNAPYNNAYHDLALYHGHFFLTWGPTPVLTLFAPFRLTGYWMSESFAVALFGFVGLVCAVGLLHILVDRLIPATPRWFLLAGTVCLALTNVIPFILRRPAQYEVAISCGYCFEMAGLLLCISALRRDRLDPWRLGFGSLCLGLAIGGRPDLVFGGAAALGVALWAIKRRAAPRTVLIPALAPFLICGLMVAAYNTERFGVPTEFGARYALTGINENKAVIDSFKWLLPGLETYFLLPARLALTFPHAFLMTSASLPFSLPSGYAGTAALPFAEPTGGLLPTMPITLLLVAVPILWRQRRQAERSAIVAALGLVALGLITVGLLSFGLFATTQRYEADFASLLLLPALLVWAILLARQPRRTARRRVLLTLGVALITFGAFVGAATSLTGYYNLLDIEHPGEFDALEGLTAPFVTVATVIAGHAEIVRVDSPALISTPSGYSSLTDNGSSVWLGASPAKVVIVSPDDEHVSLVATLATGPGAPPATTLDVLVSGGGAPVMTRIVSPTLRIPLDLHTGLNRFILSLAGLRAGVVTSPTELALENLELSR